MITANARHRTKRPKLSAAERSLLSAVTKGAVVDYRVKKPRLDDPSGGAAWGDGRTVRAEVLVGVLTGDLPGQDGRPRAVNVVGARISGSLDLGAATLICPLALLDCYIDEPIDLNNATAAALRMSGCHLPSLTATRLHVVSDFRLDRVVFSANNIDLVGAHIGGSLDLRAVSLVNPGKCAVLADRLTVDQDLYCRDGFTVTGELRLPDAHIGGQFDLSSASLINPDGSALTADRLAVERDMVCQDGFNATGEIRLPGAHIGGQLDLTGAQLANPVSITGRALFANDLTVGRSMLCGNGFNATGEICLSGAHIGGQLDLTGAQLANPYGWALNAPRLTVEGDMLCGHGFKANGEVCMNSAHIAGELNLSLARLARPADPHMRALDLGRAYVAVFRLRPLQQPDGAVDLTSAKVGILEDDPETWPEDLYLNGFAYDVLGDIGVTTRRRLEWLTRNHYGYAPQLYDQLASVYRCAGDEHAARKVAVTKERRRRHPYSPLSWLWYLSVGYGYRPWLAGVWVIALVILGTVVFSHAYPAHMIAISAHPPAFHAAAYASDLLVPVIGLGQKSAWQPQGSGYQYWSWAFTGAGWILTTAVVAGLAGILKRN